MTPASHQQELLRRTTSVTALPQQLFMIMRVITILRGVFRSLRVDVHACTLWQHLAAETLAEDTSQVHVRAHPAKHRHAD